MKQYEELKRRFANGWNTWNTYSMTSHVLLPDGFAVSLGVKEFDRGHYKAHFWGISNFCKMTTKTKKERL